MADSASSIAAVNHHHHHHDYYHHDPHNHNYNSDTNDNDNPKTFDAMVVAIYTKACHNNHYDGYDQYDGCDTYYFSLRRKTAVRKHAYFHSEDSLPSLAPLRIPLGSKLVKDDIVRDLVFESTETI
nr:hypothetical protein BaRGS_033581 [Batillaria attramentaria]